jgi:hypothetical protein
MKQCAGCDRFVEPDEEACPFCEHQFVDPTTCSPLQSLATSGWAQMGAAALSFAGVTAMAACAYGVPQPDLCPPGEVYDHELDQCLPDGDVDAAGDTGEPDIGDTDEGDTAEPMDAADTDAPSDGGDTAIDTADGASGDTAGDTNGDTLSDTVEDDTASGPDTAPLPDTDQAGDTQ